MTPMDFIVPILKGSMVVFLMAIIGYGIFYMIQKSGLFKLYKKYFKGVITDDIYEYVAEEISKGSKLADIVQYTTRFPLKTQEKYIHAYFELNKLKGGKKNG